MSLDLARCVGLLLLVGLVGCGSSDGRVDLQGRVTFQGQPVPGGRILFTPDADAGNQGAGTVADIAAGRWQTRPDKGAAPGAYHVTIYGTDSTPATETHDNSLFPPYETKLEVTLQNKSHDFAIP